MYVQNFSSNQKKTGDDKADKTNQKNVLQREIIMQESDLQRSVNEKVKLEFEIRKIKDEEAQLRIRLRDGELRLAKMDQDIKVSEEALHSLKKKLNLL